LRIHINGWSECDFACHACESMVKTIVSTRKITWYIVWERFIDDAILLIATISIMIAVLLCWRILITVKLIICSQMSIKVLEVIKNVLCDQQWLRVRCFNALGTVCNNRFYLTVFVQVQFEYFFFILNTNVSMHASHRWVTEVTIASNLTRDTRQ
jgi:hypothetical protein